MRPLLPRLCSPGTSAPATSRSPRQCTCTACAKTSLRPKSSSVAMRWTRSPRSTPAPGSAPTPPRPPSPRCRAAAPRLEQLRGPRRLDLVSAELEDDRLGSDTRVPRYLGGVLAVLGTGLASAQCSTAAGRE